MVELESNTSINLTKEEVNPEPALCLLELLFNIEEYLVKRARGNKLRVKTIWDQNHSH